ncbi:MAG: class II glutamine amidotransferase [Lachnospiraceae bacterium]|nr:class II glutamine amidotransferase [Lachnospiraceae bacterium]
MCELFGVSATQPVAVNDLLKEFFSHSVEHPNGWGMAFFHGNAVSLEKEPTPAFRSGYLKRRLRHPFEADAMIAHIRLATVGSEDYENCHPFVRRDRTDCAWTLAHNGTMFDCPRLSPYQYVQEGRTDSERVLYYIVDEMDKATARRQETDGPGESRDGVCDTIRDDRKESSAVHLPVSERFDILDRILCEITPHNKVNLLIYDGEILYAHTNYDKSLFLRETEEGTLIATTPLGRRGWEELPFTTLCAFKDGRLVRQGTNHGNEYFDNEHDTHLMYLDAAAL